MTTTHLAPPKAAMLIESMRDIGYSLETALADVIDNSISAGATLIHLMVDSSHPNPKIGVLDNGAGMTRGELLEAMRLGSSSPRDPRARNDLGRFGLGMKTASFSQCRRMTVVTRQGQSTSVAVWDLDHVEREDKWELLTPENIEGIPFVEDLAADGCLLVWERLDRAVDAVMSEAARRQFVRKVDESRRHLELVFHRFLAGEVGTKKINILLNGVPLEPFDPFNSRHPSTEVGPIERVQVGTHIVTMMAFTLPHHRNVKKSEWDHYGGQDGYLKSQGFYLYREKRLIVHSTWFGLARQIELTKLCRVKIDTPNGLDAEWQVDVKKASARPPAQVRERLQKLIREIGAPSRKKYVGRAQGLLHVGRLPIWTRTSTENQIVYELNNDNPLLAEFRKRLPNVLQVEFDRLTRVMSAALPLDAIFADLAGEPENVKHVTITAKDLEIAFTATLSGLLALNVASDLIPEMLRRAEPFRSNWEQVERLLNELANTDLDEESDD